MTDSRPSRSPASTWDGDVVEQLRELQDPGEPDLVADLVRTMDEESGPLLDRLEAASAQGDCDGVSRVAHRLKGSALSLGASRLADAAAAAERAAKARDTEGVRTAVPSVRAEFDRFMARAKPR